MNRSSFAVGLIWLTGLPVFAQSDQAATDAEQINAAYNKYRTNEYRQLFAPGYFSAEFEQQVAGYREHLAKLEAFENDDLPKLESQLSQFESRYGSGRDAIRKAFQDINKAGGSIAGDPAYSWEQLKEVVAAPAQTRQQVADELVKLGSKGGQTHQGYNIMTVEESYAQAKAFLELALAYQPEHADAQQKLAVIDGEMEQRLTADEKSIDAAKFPPHSEGFQGPGSAEEMAAIATKYLSSKESGKDGKLLAVRIAGDWQVADRNLVGDTLTWGLPVEIAYREDDDPKTAKVVSAELITRGKEQEPPFQRHRYFGSRYVRVANLPQTAGAGGFGLLRLPLAGLLILLGLVAAAPLVEERVPATKTYFAKVKPFAPMIGVVTLVLGVTAFLFGIFSPLQDLFPLAAAIVVGTVMGLDVLVKRSNFLAERSAADEEAPADGDLKQKAQHAMNRSGDAAKEAVTKAQQMLIERQESIRKLDAVRVPLGLGCIVLGLLHLVAGGFLFF